MYQPLKNLVQSIKDKNVVQSIIAIVSNSGIYKIKRYKIWHQKSTWSEGSETAKLLKMYLNLDQQL